MEPENQIGTVVTNRKWQLRWGHILLALFVIVLIVIAYVVIHQIQSADRASQTCLTTNSCANGAGNTKLNGGSKTAKSGSSHKSTKKNSGSTNTNSKSKSSSQTSTNSSSSSTSSSSNSNATSTPTTTNNNSSTSTSTPSTTNSKALANTGPGDTLGLFGVTAVAGTMLHYLYNKRRLRTTQAD